MGKRRRVKRGDRQLVMTQMKNEKTGDEFQVGQPDNHLAVSLSWAADNTQIGKRV